MPAVRASKPKSQPIATRRSARLMKAAAPTTQSDAPSVSAESLNVRSSTKRAKAPSVSTEPLNVPTPTSTPTTIFPAVIPPVVTPSTNTISPPVLPKFAKPFAPTRTLYLPWNYVPRRSRNSFIIFRSQFNAQIQQSLMAGIDTQETVSLDASTAWNALSAAEKQPFKDVAKAEAEIFKMRFPKHKHLAESRGDYAVEWSIDSDYLFVINAAGAVQLEAPTSDDDSDAPPSREATPEAAVEESGRLFFDWELGEAHQGNAYQDTTVNDLPIPYLPYPLIPSSPTVYPMDSGASSGPSNTPFHFYNGPPMNPFFAPDYSGVYNPGPYAGSHFVPTPDYEQFLTPAPAAIYPNISYNVDQLQEYPPGSLLGLLYSD